MAFPTAVNSQITDAVTQANVKVIAEDPAKTQSEQAKNSDDSESRAEQRPEADRSRQAER